MSFVSKDASVKIPQANLHRFLDRENYIQNSVRLALSDQWRHLELVTLGIARDPGIKRYVTTDHKQAGQNFSWS